jgi:glycosyltransferase involved in cell wall biosynthesis
MRICLIAHAFAPSLGGIETVAETLARGFAAHGHDVTVATRTAADAHIDERMPFTVRRGPSPLELLRTVAASDVVLHNNPVTRWLWPSIVMRKPTVIAHHTWLANDPRATQRVKRHILAQFTNVAVSHVLAERLPGDVRVIPNGYDPSIFFDDGPSRPGDLLFVGRLVSDKGCDLLIDALHELHSHDAGQAPTLRIVGDGPDRVDLLARIEQLGLNRSVKFLGRLTPVETAQQMRQCRVLVVPSRWREPFGLVALEGAACGCRVVAPDGTGTNEAAGSAVVPFVRGNTASLAGAIRTALSLPIRSGEFVKHLQAHDLTRQVEAYLQQLNVERVLRGHNELAASG